MNKLLILLVGVLIAGTVIPQDKLLLLREVVLTLIANNDEQLSSDSGTHNQKEINNTGEQVKISSSQIYKWVDKDGRTHFSTEPPKENTQFTSKEYDNPLASLLIIS